MNLRLRAVLVLLGALLVAATYTFPVWQPLLDRDAVVREVFPGLPPDLVTDFQLLPAEQRAAFLALADADASLAARLAVPVLRGDQPVPEDAQALPDMVGEEVAVSGDFATLTPILGASGQIVIYQLADGSKMLRFEDFRATNAPGVVVFLSGNRAPTTREELEQNGLFYEVGRLQGNVGGQNFPLPPQVDLARYNSVVLFSEPLGIVVSSAAFRLRFL